MATTLDQLQTEDYILYIRCYGVASNLLLNARPVGKPSVKPMANGKFHANYRKKLATKLEKLGVVFTDLNDYQRLLLETLVAD